MNNFFSSQQQTEVFKCLLENKVIKRIYDATGELGYAYGHRYDSGDFDIIKREALFMTNICMNKNVIVKNPLLKGSKCFSILAIKENTDGPYYNNPILPYSILKTKELDVNDDLLFVPGVEELDGSGHYYRKDGKKYYISRFIVIDPPEEIWDQITTKEYKETGLVPVLYKEKNEENEILKKRLEDLETKFDLLYSIINKNE